MSSVVESLSCFVRSSIGKKILVAVTGLVLVVFVLGHMIGNLLAFAGPDAINAYGHLLQTSLHGGGVWIARLGLLAAVLVHVVATISLTRQSRAARPDAYGRQKAQVSGRAARTMIWSGLTLLCFIVFHLLHFTVRNIENFSGPDYEVVLDGEKMHNVYKMVVVGFSNVGVSAFYILSMVLLYGHLSHGVSSLFQTLGLATHRSERIFKGLGHAYALLILVGNCSIPLAVIAGVLK